MGCWPGHRHAGAPPPASGLGGARGFLRTRSYHKPCAAAISRAQLPGSHKPCVSACGRVCSPPPAFSTSPWLLGTLARSLPWRCAAARVGIGRGTGSSCAHTTAKGAATSRARVPVLRRICSAQRVVSTNRWLHGALVRSLTCKCAAAPRHRIRGSCAHSCQGQVSHKPCACAGGGAEYVQQNERV